MNRATSAAIAGVALVGVVLAATPAQAASLQARALKVAAAQKNDPYRYGAAGPTRFDCSGLVYYSYKQSGRTLARTAQGQYNKSLKVSPGSRRVGDLVFIGTSSRGIYHVGVYAGSGKMWNANTGAYRGRKIVLAPVTEYTKGAPNAYYGRY